MPLSCPMLSLTNRRDKQDEVDKIRDGARVRVPGKGMDSYEGILGLALSIYARRTFMPSSGV